MQAFALRLHAPLTLSLMNACCVSSVDGEERDLQHGCLPPDQAHRLDANHEGLFRWFHLKRSKAGMTYSVIRHTGSLSTPQGEIMTRSQIHQQAEGGCE